MIVLVGLGGFLGAVLRFFVYEIISKLTYMFGSMLLGHKFLHLLRHFLSMLLALLLLGFCLRMFKAEIKAIIQDIWTHFFGIGLLGAFTTFSAFSYANVLLLQGGLYGQLLLNIIGNVGICLLATFCGFVMYRGS